MRKGQSVSAAAPTPPVVAAAAAPRGPTGPAAAAAPAPAQPQPRPTPPVSAAAQPQPRPAPAISRGGKNSKGSQKKKSNRQKLRDPKPRSGTYTVYDGDCNCQLQLRVRVDTAVNGVNSCLHSVVFNVEFPHRRLHTHALGSSADRAAYHMIALTSGTSVAAEVGSIFPLKLAFACAFVVLYAFTCHARSWTWRSFSNVFLFERYL